MQRLRTILLSTGLVLLAMAGVRAVEIAQINDLRPGELPAVGFELGKDARVTIEAVGMRPRHADEMTVYAWILDTDTRQPVWVMQAPGTDRVRGSRLLREAKDSEMLEAGKYELYMYAGRYWSWNDHSINLKDIINEIFSKDWDDEDLEELDKCYVRVTSDELSSGDIGTFSPDGGFPDALIRHTHLGDSEYIRSAFKLDHAMDLRLYALIEFPRGYREPVDQAWIVDNESREKVWEISKWDVEYAGGGRKNQVFDDEISLPAGEYTLFVVTDDSHSFEEFNVAPPYDPLNWGVTILPGRDFNRGSFARIEVPDRGEAIIDFTRARDNDYFEQSFKVDRETTLRIYAIGEYAKGHRGFVDYGAIQEAGSGRLVWEMTERNTAHAGGGEKNRMYDGTVTLGPGAYTAFYVTDDSHAYNDWNTSPPYDARSYGMAIYPVDNGGSGVELVSEQELVDEGNLLVRLTRMRDNEQRRERFTLKEDAWVHIYAIGEGTGGRMYDYAYIVDEATGRDVWEMTWRKTDHAGGASKNRVFDDMILLPEGTYEVVYVTDGSHSFADWNSTPPRDPMNWGITITFEEKR
ncbi:hypothetical protein GF420_01930 [candidate division GN15 bacterium]|nr:hypothetical protein [candidate division GN15 bacterium]